MKCITTPIPDLYVLQTEPRQDERGFFERRFCVEELGSFGINASIKQINRSLSKKAGTLRGLHFQVVPMCEMKIVQCLRGRIFDVAIDLRKDSATFLKWHGEILDEQNGRSLCIPRGFAHGFQSLTDNSETLYFTDQLYSPGHERIIHHADPAINITWPVKVTAISPKDKYGLWIDDNFEPIHLDGAV